MGVWETNEDLFQGAFGEILAEVTHGIGSDNWEMIVFAGIGCP